MIAFSQFFLEYRHNNYDGSPALSVHPNNGKLPDRVLDRKIPQNIGPYNPIFKKLGINNSIITAPELEQMGLTHEPEKTVTNYKNSGSDIHMTIKDGLPVGIVIKRK